MTWYRVGPAGIPGSLKTDMDAVLNKKFGTSTTYAPNTWPDNVNLLGPLPEKTASGAIASITDGADGVPLKNWLVTLPASLDGYTKVNAERSGKNLVNGYIDYNETNKVVEPIFLKAGNYTISFQRDAVVAAIYIRKGDTVSLRGDAYLQKFNTTFFAFNADADGYYYFQFYRSGSSTTWEDAPITNVQLEVGSTATAYEAYEAPTQYTASLGRTIYGGTADIEVTSRADISLALQALGGGVRVLMGMMMQRQEEEQLTEEDPEEQPEEAETNER